MRTLLRVWAIFTLAMAAVSEYLHCASLDVPEHPAPRGWAKFRQAGFTASCGGAIYALVVT